MNVIKFRKPDQSVIEIGFSENQLVPSIGDSVIYNDAIYIVKSRVHSFADDITQAYGVSVLKSSFEIILENPKTDIN